MNRRRLVVPAALAALAAVPAATGAATPATPANPPKLCAGDFYADVIGTPRADRLKGTGRVERLYGLAGDDRLVGSATRLTCLIGGPGDDDLELEEGGGLAYGESGDDLLVGSPLDDQLYGGGGRDAYTAGEGDDKLDTRDNLGEVVDCGDGNDLVTADRVDLLVGCETVLVDGDANPTASTPARPSRVGAPVRASIEAPASAPRGAYRVLLTTQALGRPCADGPRVVARSTRAVAAGDRVAFTLRPPTRWCRGTSKAGVILVRGSTTPRPVARLEFETR